MPLPVPHAHLRAANPAPCPTCAKPPGTIRPRLVRTHKECPVCGKRFYPTRIIHSSGATRAHVGGFVTCSKACARQLAVDPLTGVDLAKQVATCSGCGTVLAYANRLGECRLCRIERNVRTGLRRAYRKRLLKRKRRDAIMAYELSDLEVIE